MTPRFPALLLAALLAAAAPAVAPAVAQDAEGPQGEPSGFDLIGQGAGQLLQGFAAEAAPALDGIAQGLPDWGADWGAEVFPTVTAIVTEMGPGFFAAFRQVDSLANSEAPALQPNGDILIRRSEGAPEWTPPAP